MIWEKIFEVRCKKTIKIEKLEQQLKEANEVIDFYGDENGWEVVTPDNQYLECITIDDGGKKARSYLEKYRNKNEL